MRIVILGSSGSGKTPIAELVAKDLGIKLKSATNWITENLPRDGSTKQEHINILGDVELLDLQKGFSSSLDYLQDCNGAEPMVIEGIRNPKDFIDLFDLRRDVVVFLNRKNNPYKTHSIEQGIVVIDQYVNWAANCDLMDKEKRVNYLFEAKDIPEVVSNFLQLFRYRGWCLRCGDVGCQHQRS